MKLCCQILAVTVLACAVLFRETLVFVKENAVTAYKGFQNLRAMPAEDIDNFFQAYDVLEQLGADDQHGVKNPKEAKAIHDFYKVLNQVLAVGVVMEIMLLPPSLDPSAGVLKNIDLWMDRMISFLDLKPGMKVLDVGSGRGKIAAKVQKDTGAKVIQLNIDETQIAFSKELAKENGNEDLMEWHIMDYNDPYPFIQDGTLDAQYCAQACAFMSDKSKFLKKVFQKLKPGGMVYNLEWLAKDKSENASVVANYDSSNKDHRELVRQTGVLVGGSFPSGINEWEVAFKEAGFELIASREPAPIPSLVLLDKTNKVYEPLTHGLVWLADMGVVSPRFRELFLRLRTYWEGAVKAHELELVSLTYEFVARKPL